MLPPGHEYADRVTIPFFGSVSASGTLTMKSERLNFFYTTRRISVSFPLNTNRTVEAHPLISHDPDIPTTGRPTGQFLFEPHGNVRYLVGDDERVSVAHETTTFQKATYCCLYLVNHDSFVHRIFGTFEIQRILETKET